MRLTMDDYITRITNAPTDADAMRELDGVGRRMLALIADQLYVDDYDHVKRAIVAEARA